MIDHLSISYLGDAELYIVCALLYSSDLECMLVSCRVFLRVSVARISSMKLTNDIYLHVMSNFTAFVCVITCNKQGQLWLIAV